MEELTSFLNLVISVIIIFWGGLISHFMWPTPYSFSISKTALNNILYMDNLLLDLRQKTKRNKVAIVDSNRQ